MDRTSKPSVAASSGASSGSITNTIGMTLALIPAGEFTMGSPDDDTDAGSAERPEHGVRITRPFYLGIHEVKQAEYVAVMGHNPSFFAAGAGGEADLAGQSTDQSPVESVSWFDAVEFCNNLSKKEGLRPFYEVDGQTVRVPDWSRSGYRLPTEAEWEHACRANSQTPYSFGTSSTAPGESAWYGENSDGRTHPAGQKKPNAFGLFDMHGNVWEWGWDEYGDRYYDDSPVDDPRGPTGVTPPRRVIRGGGGVIVSEPWISTLRNARSASRIRCRPEARANYLGFRVARNQPSK
jgi:formylglycine-generating enzyme required for sulfatase activity